MAHHETGSAQSQVTRTTAMETDVAVVGGGMAGVCAALAAARHGAQVVLVQDRPSLGGNASSEVRMHVCGADCSGGRPGWRESGLIDELRVEDAVRNPQHSFSMFELLLWEWVRRESNITLLLNTSCVAAQTRGARIESARCVRPSTEDAFDLRGALFVDSSGDGRLGAEAGAQSRMGRESRDEFGESMAPERADNWTLGSSISFVARDMGRPVPFTAPTWARRFLTDDDLPYRNHDGFVGGFWWMAWGGTLDTIKDNERIRDELLAIALGVWDHLKNRGDHGADNYALEWVGMVPGKRESRRFVGDHVLCQADVEEARPFDDAVAYGGWSLDLHPPEGIDSPGPPSWAVPVEDIYGIPLRSLYSCNVDNLFMAGRNISATHVAFGSTRVMATCAVMGQAVGTAAALCVAERCTPRQLYHDHCAALQQALLKADAFIPGVANTDEADLALRATVSATSAEPTCEPACVVQGPTRAIGENANQWRSVAGQPWPQWLELRWPNPIRLSEVRLLFDTGFHRSLTITLSPGYRKRMVLGPQPETVRDYELLAHIDGQWRSLLSVTGNYQRSRVHRLEPASTDAIRVQVHATNGDPHARVFEVRVY